MIVECLSAVGWQRFCCVIVFVFYIAISSTVSRAFNGLRHVRIRMQPESVVYWSLSAYLSRVLLRTMAINYLRPASGWFECPIPAGDNILWPAQHQQQQNVEPLHWKSRDARNELFQSFNNADVTQRNVVPSNWMTIKIGKSSCKFWIQHFQPLLWNRDNNLCGTFEHTYSTQLLDYFTNWVVFIPRMVGCEWRQLHQSGKNTTTKYSI